MAKEKEGDVKVVKVSPRKFRVVGQHEDGSDLNELVAPAEYAVTKGGERLALMVKTGDGWRVCKPTEASKLGAAVSPVGLDGFREVKRWALETFA